ncbi:SorT family sulfite dehydrogenase catalytic subunit [Ideonella sp. BN130291]|uniref:SorT family sulfite dehydrogenase catalytic subunit n=1 Tax=Ideonella sp. BN130291 TaxID=3112940 RepID=UPI002E2577D1|nr:sulfite oxidase [Ideonella sp. BN130291]
MTENLKSPRRRQMLAGSASALAAAGAGAFALQARAQAPAAAAAASAAPAAPQAKPLPGYAAWKDSNSLIVHTSNTIETKRSAFGTSVITPGERLYVRNNLPPPDAAILANRDAWELWVDGVKNPRKLTLAELKSLGVETVATVLQCSGNGRGYFASKPSGTPWQVGAAGCVLWSGVPVRAVVEALGGVASGMRFMTGTGGEKLPDGVDPKTVVVERSLPLSAMGDALLAWEMNGAPLSLAHGAPLRLIVPGYSGVNNIKYLQRLAFAASESDAKIMSHGYRITPPGGKADPSQPSVLEMQVKSWVNTPGGEEPAKAGRTMVTGVAFSGGSPIKRVEVSVDGGRSWRDAKLVGPDLGKYAWRQFALPVDLAAGTHVIASRATDAAGNVQPEQRLENVGGYNNNSWADHAVKVTVA